MQWHHRAAPAQAAAKIAGMCLGIGMLHRAWSQEWKHNQSPTYMRTTTGPYSQAWRASSCWACTGLQMASRIWWPPVWSWARCSMSGAHHPALPMLRSPCSTATPLQGPGQLTGCPPSAQATTRKLYQIEEIVTSIESLFCHECVKNEWLYKSAQL